MGETVYTCLLCEGRPIFTNRVAAYAHARAEHRSLLIEHHVDELFETHEGTRIPVELDDGPFVCLQPGCAAHRVDHASIRGHLNASHQIKDGQRGVDYASEEEHLRMLTERKREARVQGDAFARALASIRGVADFLTECGP